MILATSGNIYLSTCYERLYEPNYKPMIRRILTLTLALVFIILSGRGVFAISPADIQSVDNDTEYYDSAQATAVPIAGDLS